LAIPSTNIKEPLFLVKAELGGETTLIFYFAISFLKFIFILGAFGILGSTGICGEGFSYF
jgi:hypothetical protein